ncbi:DegV family protein [Caproiciproducens galactitolivorans]|uniref:DegV family protein n=1 Tax=Caproiciproducens galactitolivorans TaxID=642589 RepID=A0ABT4BZ23_9FIRM|nr:DegV family protein [Caproiciproducens galactitolivorans]MCY1715298.1 DegV family protein [Caproiciproducens galactitolivorans]
MSWGIISDSSCDLPSSAFADSGLHFAAVPLKIVVGGTEYTDNDDLNVNAMLAHMKSFKGPSSSACPAPEEWAREFRKSDRTVAVTMTSALSGTYNSALIGKNMVLEESPEKDIHVIDSHTTGGGLVLILRKLEELISAGLDFEAVVKQAEAYTRSIFLLFSCGSYDNLVKNGRMSRIAGILASSLGIRAVASNTPEGTIRVLQKPRGEERALEVIVRTMSEWKNLAGMPVVITHCNDPVGAQRLKEKIAHVCMTTKITIMQTRGLTSFYNDNGGLMIAF